MEKLTANIDYGYVHYLFDFEHGRIRLYSQYLLICVKYVYYAYMHALHFTVCLSVSIDNMIFLSL